MYRAKSAFRFLSSFLHKITVIYSGDEIIWKVEQTCLEITRWNIDHVAFSFALIRRSVFLIIIASVS